MRSLISIVALALTACAAGGSYSGTVVDAMSGQPRADVRVIAKAEGTTDMTCMAKESAADANGNFTLANLCDGNTYNLSLSDEQLLIQDAAPLDGGAAVSDVKLQTWRAPSGAGIYILKDDQLSMVRTFTDVKYETKIDDDATKVAYPYMKPTRLSYTVEPGSWFVISGKANVDRLEFHPLIPDTGKRTFKDGSIEDHIWVGTRFKSDTEWETVEAKPDASKVKMVTSGDRIVHYIPSDALPEGRYAIFGEKDQRMFIVDFGKSQNAPEEAAAGGDAAEGG